LENREKLKNLLMVEIIPDLEEAIDDMFAMINKEKMVSIADKEELQELLPASLIGIGTQLSGYLFKFSSSIPLFQTKY